MKTNFLAIFLLFSACVGNYTKENSFANLVVPKTYILKSSAKILVQNDLVFVSAKNYSGFVYELQANQKDTLSLEGYFDGKLEGNSKKWYANQQLKEERCYKNGAKSGNQLAFWENGNKKFQFFAQNDVYEGEMKEWDAKGNLIHLANYKNGHEEGVQKLWNDEGKIKANYVILGGKRYGLLGTKNCRNVSDSIFVNQ